jgi:CRISPR-associated protein Csx10
VSPVIAADSVQGNEWLSYDYLPGNLLLPLVRQIDSAAVAQAVALGDLVVGPAYPAPDAAISVSPAPFALQRPKHGGAISNRFSAASTEQMKPVRNGYVAEDGARIVFQKRGPNVVHMHNTIEDPLQRPTSDVGGLFSYAAIPPGVTLRSTVQTRGVGSEIDLMTLAGRHRIGRSRKDDYGLVDVAVEAVSDQRKPPELVDDMFWFSLRSPAILRDANLRPDPTPSRLLRHLSAALGPGVVLVWENEQVASRTIRRQSWHAGWGLPRPTLVALDAGSCGRVRVQQGTVDSHAFARVQAEGIGERRAEGYGWIEFNPRSLTGGVIEGNADGAETVAGPGPFATLERQVEPFANALALEAARRLISAAPLHGVRFVGDSALSPSQLGALREAVLHSGTSGVRRWLKSATENKKRMEAWGEHRLKDLLDRPGTAWGAVDPTATVGTSLRELLQNEAFAAVIAAMCRNGQKGETE